MFDKKRTIIAFALALLLSIAGYFINNSPYFDGEDLDSFYYTQRLKKKSANDNFTDSVAFFDVSYDKMIVNSVEGIYSKDTLGQIAITDRHKLATFLKLLHESDKYKYVILDIGFETSEQTPYDDELFSIINEMRDIVVVETEEKSAIPDYLKSKSFVSFSDFKKSFTRYEFLKHDNLKSLPLAIFEKINPDKEIKKSGWTFLPYYTSGGRLCQNTCFVTMPDYVPDSKYISHTLNGTRMGYNYLKYVNTKGEQFVIDKLSNNTQDKYVFICDFQNDQLQTYYGNVPGAYVVWRAFVCLMEERNIVSVLNLLCWFILYFIILWGIVSNISIADLVPKFKNKKLKFLNFILDNLSYPVLVGLATYLEFCSGHMVHSILIPCAIMSLLKLYVSFENYDE